MYLLVILEIVVTSNNLFDSLNCKINKKPKWIYRGENVKLSIIEYPLHIVVCTYWDFRPSILSLLNDINSHICSLTMYNQRSKPKSQYIFRKIFIYDY